MNTRQHSNIHKRVCIHITHMHASRSACWLFLAVHGILREKGSEGKNKRKCTVWCLSIMNRFWKWKHKVLISKWAAKRLLWEKVTLDGILPFSAMSFYKPSLTHLHGYHNHGYFCPLTTTVMYSYQGKPFRAHLLLKTPYVIKKKRIHHFLILHQSLQLQAFTHTNNHSVI